ncbi:MAG: hypothetical protein IPJ77_20640 [Planctomycetes bacterium]|nr:hypothetical protein [Planctomycetota bacterium]
MVARQKNLLEAFRASAPEGRAAQKRKPDAPVHSGGPFAGGAGGAWGASKAARLEFGERGGRSFLARVFGDRTVRLVVLGILVVGVAAWLLRSGPEAGGIEAAEPPSASGDPGSFARPAASSATAAPTVAPAADPARSNQVAAQLGTTDDQAFHDPKNEFTVRVAQYKNDENGLKLARATVAWLRKEGYPAVQPIRTGGTKPGLIVCVGAKPKTKDLDTLVEFLRGLRGPPPQSKEPPFRDAYVVRIDDVLKRR